MPEQAVPVSMHAWMDNLRRTPPGPEIQDYLTIRQDTRQSLGEWERKNAADVSDTLIFDFLIDGMCMTG